jgi:hypothetical protein
METSDTLPYPNVSAALSVNDKYPAQGEPIFSLCPQNAPYSSGITIAVLSDH